MKLISVIFLTLALVSCGGSNGGGDTPDPGLQVLARNVILSNANASVNAKSVDPETQVYASNVVYDNSNSTLEATNAQDAFDELSLDFATTMVGSWTIVNKNQESNHEATGAVTINADNTFNLTAGSFAAIGMGSSGLCSHQTENQTYEFYTDKVAVFSHYNGETQNSVIPTLLELKENQITVLGSGGCGEVGRQRISILTRVQ